MSKNWKSYRKKMSGICKYCSCRNLQEKCYVCGKLPRKKGVTIGNKDIQHILKDNDNPEIW